MTDTTFKEQNNYREVECCETYIQIPTKVFNDWLYVLSKSNYKPAYKIYCKMKHYSKPKIKMKRTKHEGINK